MRGESAGALRRRLPARKCRSARYNRPPWRSSARPSSTETNRSSTPRPRPLRLMCFMGRANTQRREFDQTTDLLATPPGMGSMMGLLRRILKPQYVWRPLGIPRRVLRRHAPWRPEGRARVRLPWGVELEIETGEEIGRTLWEQGIHDLLVSEAIWRLLDPGATAVDGGAYVGYTTSLMVARVGATGRVAAFEPHPTLFSELEANLDRWRRAGEPWPRLELFRAALSDRSGSATLVSDPGFATNRGLSRVAEGEDGRPVETATLDERFGSEQIALLKLDVEGHEAAALRGAETLIDAGRIRHVLYEDHLRGESPTHSWLRHRGFTVFGLGRSLWRPLLVADLNLPDLAAHESPNYLATLDPGETVRRFRPLGWRVL